MTDTIFPHPAQTSPTPNGSSPQKNTEEDAFFESEVISGDDAEQLVNDLVDQDAGIGQNLEHLSTAVVNAEITGGDLDDDAYQASVVGEEAVGGQTSTPDQNITEELQRAVGISAADGESVRTMAKLEWRDHHRWGLNPESSEDYQERHE